MFNPRRDVDSLNINVMSDLTGSLGTTQYVMEDNVGGNVATVEMSTHAERGVEKASGANGAGRVVQVEREKTTAEMCGEFGGGSLELEDNLVQTCVHEESGKKGGVQEGVIDEEKGHVVESAAVVQGDVQNAGGSCELAWHYQEPPLQFIVGKTLAKSAKGKWGAGKGLKGRLGEKSATIGGRRDKQKFQEESGEVEDGMDIVMVETDVSWKRRKESNDDDKRSNSLIVAEVGDDQPREDQ